MNKKILSLFVLLVLVSGATKTFASLTFSSAAITGDTASTIDVGAGNALSLQTTNNGNIITGSGNFGVGIGIPTQKLDVVGFVNTDLGYKQAGNTILFTKTSNHSTAVGASSAASWMATTPLDYSATAVGYGALATTPVDVGGLAWDNSAFGVNSLASTTTGGYNVAVGGYSLFSNTTGWFNTTIGDSSLGSTTTGWGNSANGNGALLSNTTGSYNTALGMSALYYNSVGSNNIALGHNAGSYETGSNSFYVDNQDRLNTAGDKANAILYGIMAPAAVNQTLHINAVVMPIQATTAAAPAYVKGGMYFDTTLNKLRVGGATGWETVTSS
ncbi:MAG: hypothetical protein WC793_00330 [Candidatus Paceibacterota bacterium]|jgi:hypothetical protein